MECGDIGGHCGYGGELTVDELLGRGIAHGRRGVNWRGGGDLGREEDRMTLFRYRCALSLKLAR